MPSFTPTSSAASADFRTATRCLAGPRRRRSRRFWMRAGLVGEGGDQLKAHLRLDDGSLTLTCKSKEKGMRITSKGQVTIPAEIREQAGLLPHTEADCKFDGREVTIGRAKRPPK